MKKYDILKLVQEEVLTRLDEFMVQSTTPAQQPSKIAIFPGAPFGGNLSIVMNNESRAALRQWAKFVKACQTKFGEVGEWPQEMTTAAQKLGSKVERLSQPDNVNEDAPSGKKPADQAKEMGLSYDGYGYWSDRSGKRVAQTVNGNLVKLDAQEPPAEAPKEDPAASAPVDGGVPSGEAPSGQDAGDIEAKLAELLKGLKMPGEESDITDPALLKAVMKTFKSNGRWVPQSQDTGSTAIKPGWNKAYEDIPYDANGEETVNKLLKMVGDPMKLLRWLIKTFKKETANGKQRIMQYISILKSMGVLDQQDVQDAQSDKPQNYGDFMKGDPMSSSNQ